MKKKRRYQIIKSEIWDELLVCCTRRAGVPATRRETVKEFFEGTSLLCEKERGQENIEIGTKLCGHHSIPKGKGIVCFAFDRDYSIRENYG